MSNDTGGRLLPAAAVGLLFAVMAVTFANAGFESAAGFPEGESVVHNIGYALFNLGEYGVATIPSEGFLAAFLIVAVALDVAVDGAIYLARREADESVVAAVGAAITDGGRAIEDGNRDVGGEVAGGNRDVDDVAGGNRDVDGGRSTVDDGRSTVDDGRSTVDGGRSTVDGGER